jgi:hypothetical protein
MYPIFRFLPTVSRQRRYLPIGQIIQSRQSLDACVVHRISVCKWGVAPLEPVLTHGSEPYNVLSRYSRRGNTVLHTAVIDLVLSDFVICRQKHPEVLINIFVQCSRPSRLSVQPTDWTATIALCGIAGDYTVCRKIMYCPNDHRPQDERCLSVPRSCITHHHPFTKQEGELLY